METLEMCSVFRISLATFLIGLCACSCTQGRSVPNRVDSYDDLRQFEGSRVVVRGEARDAKMCAVLVRDDFVLDVPDLVSWPDDVGGRVLDITGTLERVEIGEDHVNEDGMLVTAPSPGTYWRVRDVQWTIAEP
jgi:hypothetical protein